MRSVLWGAALTAALTLTVTPAHAAPAGTERVSTGADGTQSATASRGGTVSANGRYAVYGTLGPADGCPADFSTCVFVRDLRTGARTQVPGTGTETFGMTISADGRRVGYTTGTYHFFKAYVYDRAGGGLQQLWPTNPPTDTWYERSDITGFSADGDHVAYIIGNRNGNSGSRHLLVRDLTTGADEVIDPVDHLGNVTGGQLSADGRFVAYGLQKSSQTSLYVKDRATGEVRRIDTAPDGTPADGTSAIVQISGDGRRVLFNSRATNLLPGEPAPAQDQAYLADLRTGRVQRVGDSGAVAQSADAGGRFVVLREQEALVLLDLRTGRRQPVAPTGTAVPGAVSRHGREVVFTSSAADLVPNDTNGVSDVFVHHIKRGVS